MRYLSLFSGIEAATVAWHPLGWKCVAVAEIEPFPCAVLAHHYPGVPNLGSVTEITESQIAALGPIDIVVFGSPCQDLSVAGHRKGLLDAHGNATRSGLFFTAINIVHWARKHGGCRWALWENVPGAFSSNTGRDFAAVVEWMAGLDDVAVPENGWGSEGVALGSEGLLEWCVLDAQWFGVAQRRRRVFALADFGDWTNRPPVLLECESLRGDIAPRREAGEKPAPTISARPTGGGGLGTDFDLDGGILPVSMAHGQGGAEIGFDRGPTLICNHEAPIVAHSLRGEGFVASEDGTGRGTPLVPVVTDTLTSNGDAHSGFRDEKGLVPVAFPANLSGTQVATAEDLSPSMGAKNPTVVAYSMITANTNANGLGVSEEISPTLDRAQPAAVAYPMHGGMIGRELKNGPSGSGFGDANDPSYTLTAGGMVKHGVVTPMQVRRLTPVECERLQGFPDNYTNIPWRGKDTAPDGPRYKALGNSMAVPVMRWIGQRIDQVDTIEQGRAA